jgi:hypothetical protein
MTDAVRARHAAETYIAAYNEEDVAVKERMLAESFSEDGRYFSPNVALGRTEVLEMASDFHLEAHMTITSDIRVHHQFVTFEWSIEDLNGAEVASGVDFSVLGSDGRLSEVVVFFAD